MPLASDECLINRSSPNRDTVPAAHSGVSRVSFARITQIFEPSNGSFRIGPKWLGVSNSRSYDRRVGFHGYSLDFTRAQPMLEVFTEITKSTAVRVHRIGGTAIDYREETVTPTDCVTQSRPLPPTPSNTCQSSRFCEAAGRCLQS